MKMKPCIFLCEGTMTAEHIALAAEMGLELHPTSATASSVNMMRSKGMRERYDSFAVEDAVMGHGLPREYGYDSYVFTRITGQPLRLVKLADGKQSQEYANSLRRGE